MARLGEPEWNSLVESLVINFNVNKIDIEKIIAECNRSRNCEIQLLRAGNKVLEAFKSGELNGEVHSSLRELKFYVAQCKGI